ncbi:DUF6538 domain-containing protein [Sulfitobacter sabulilitoris]|uniref:DUF6538 domain-containing protein n=1 Tax=Sulfitobacter sabulilitoris TaxID=2562655 RepID=UPI00319E4B96
MLESKSVPCPFVKQGIFCFSRRVPIDLSHHYNASRIIYSLRTRSAGLRTRPLGSSTQPMRRPPPNYAALFHFAGVM